MKTELDMIRETLKPCLFCGGNPSILDEVSEGFFTVRCCNSNCPVLPEFRAHKGSVIAEWNTRAEPQAADVVDAVDAAMVEMRNIHPPLKRSECERLIRAALAKQPTPRATAVVVERVARGLLGAMADEDITDTPYEKLREEEINSLHAMAKAAIAAMGSIR